MLTGFEKVAEGERGECAQGESGCRLGWLGGWRNGSREQAAGGNQVPEPLLGQKVMVKPLAWMRPPSIGPDLEEHAGGEGRDEGHRKEGLSKGCGQDCPILGEVKIRA